MIKSRLLCLNLFTDLLRFLVLSLRSKRSLVENLFLRNSSRSTGNAKSKRAGLPIQHS
jgi:hypothetical protein